MADQKTLADLRKCMRAAAPDAPGDAARAVCEQAFTAAGGVVDQGKVFSIADGSAAFVTRKGKVF